MTTSNDNAITTLPYDSSSLESPTLSARELQILRLLATGATTKDVAKTLILAEGTVKQQLNTIRCLLDARNSLHAVARAIALGLISPEVALYETEWPLEHDTPAPEPLTDRELQILRLLRTPHITNKAIARALIISPKTVTRHCSNIFMKLGVQCRTDALAAARAHGLL